MADTPNIHHVTPNMAAERHAAFTITNLHGVTPCTYVTIQHGRHATRYLHKSTRHNTTWPTYQSTYVTIQHGRHTKNTLPHPQHGHRATGYIHNYQSIRRQPFHIRHHRTWPTQQKYQYTRRHGHTHNLSAFDSFPHCLLQDGVDSTGYTRRVDSTGYYICNNHIKSRALTT
jgi:hypothetical protein